MKSFCQSGSTKEPTTMKNQIQSAFLAIMLLVALLMGGLTTRVREQASTARQRERRTATLYAVSAWPNIPFMVRWHGVFNAIGFAVMGLLGWVIEDHHRLTKRAHTAET